MVKGYEMRNFRMLGLLAIVVLTSKVASAGPVIKFNLGGSGPDLQFVGGVLSTVDDGNLSTSGNQDSNLEFVGFFSGVLPDIVSGASVSIADVTVGGSPQNVGGVITQDTTGGSFSIYSPSNALLLSGSLNDGQISGSTGSSSGNFLTTNFGVFTGGSLASHFISNSVSLILAMTNIITNGDPGLRVDGNLQDFRSNSTGEIGAFASESEPVPEPASLGLLIVGLLGGSRLRRKRF